MRVDELRHGFCNISNEIRRCPCFFEFLRSSPTLVEIFFIAFASFFPLHAFLSHDHLRTFLRCLHPYVPSIDLTPSLLLALHRKYRRHFRGRERSLWTDVNRMVNRERMPPDPSLSAAQDSMRCAPHNNTISVQQYFANYAIASPPLLPPQAPPHVHERPSSPTSVITLGDCHHSGRLFRGRRQPCSLGGLRFVLP